MSLNHEMFENHGRNAIQMKLAMELYGENALSEDEVLTRWVNDGYAGRFGDFLSEHPEIEEEILLKDNEEALERLKKEVLYH